eukprot:1152482-Pelagomonas_calceolata.AAC.4
MAVTLWLMRTYLGYLGMMFYRTLNLATSAEIASLPRPVLTSAYRFCRFVCEHAMAERSHASKGLQGVLAACKDACCFS